MRTNLLQVKMTPKQWGTSEFIPILDYQPTVLLFAKNKTRSAFYLVILFGLEPTTPPPFILGWNIDSSVHHDDDDMDDMLDEDDAGTLEDEDEFFEDDLDDYNDVDDFDDDLDDYNDSPASIDEDDF